MDLERKILIDIASVSRRLADMLVKCSGHKNSESFQLEKISVASAAMMETLNKALLVESVIDDRLKDWLDSGEPKICLNVLNQMAASLRSKLNHRGVKSFFRSSPLASSKDQSIQAVKLFWKHEGYFHFLLSTNIWNRETGLQEQSVGVTPSSALRAQESATKKDSVEVMQNHAYSKTEHRKQCVLTSSDEENINDIVKWLSAYNCKEMHENIHFLRQADTCLWLPRTKAFQTWKSTENSFLWLHGKPGAGKSVLAASVIDALESSLEDGDVLAYFYCDFRNERSTSAAEVLRSLLSQLVWSFRDHAVDPSDFISELIKEREGGASVNNTRLLSRYISRATKQLIRQPFLVIDGLDECKNVEIILDAFAELQKGGNRLFVTSRPLQVIKERLSKFPSIDMELLNYEISEDINLHVTRELDSIRRLRHLGAGLKNEIHAVLCKRANCMFRWVQCQLDSLGRCATAVRIRQALNDLPTNLNETYERILLEISQDEHEGELARRALKWLVVALAPLRLSQIMEGLSIDASKQILDRDFGPVHGPALLDVLSSLVVYDELTDIVILSHFSVKEYLIAESTRIRHPAYHIDEQTAHTEVAILCMFFIGFYLEHQHSGYRGESSPSAHRTQMDDSGVVTRTKSYHWSLPPSFGFYSFDEYVLCCGFSHLYYVNPANKAIIHAMKTLHLNVQRHPTEWNRLCIRGRSSSEPRWPTLKHDFMLYFLIAFAPAPLLSSFVGHSQLQLKDGINPLIYAACFGKIEHARILLSKGVSLDHPGWDVYDEHALITPLEAAVIASAGTDSDCHTSMVDLFLDEGSCVPHSLFVSMLRGDDPKYTLDASIASRLVQTDEFVEWSLIVKNDLEDLLLKAMDPQTFTWGPGQASQQHIDIFQRRLVQIGYDLSAQFNETFLRHAVSAGHIAAVQNMLLHNIPLPSDIIHDASDNTISNSAMIRLCIDMGSDVTAVSSTTEDTALHLALIACHARLGSEEECLEKIQILIKSGCNPSTCNLAGKTPLHTAVEHGYMSIACVFLPLYVSLPPDILLATGSESPNSSLIHLLVCLKGADTHSIAANGDSPLHRVLTFKEPEISSYLDSGLGPEAEELLRCVKVLIAAGCDPCLSNADGETPFHVAVKNSHFPVVRYLYNTFNPPLPPDILLVAASNYYGPVLSPSRISVINFLIGKGASVHVPCPRGDTLVHVAIMVSPHSEMRCLKVIETLINAGCDPRASNLAGETPFHLAARAGHILIMEYLLSLGIPVPPDVMLTQFEDQDFFLVAPVFHLTIPFLLEKGGDIHTISGSGDTLLHLAANLNTYEEGYALELSEYLVHAGCATHAVNSKHETPLHIAARCGLTSVVKYLLSLDIPLSPDIILVASAGPSDERKARLIQYLVLAGADVSVVTGDGDTPLHLLLTTTIRGELEDDRLECVQILIDAGCNPSAQNLAGETPFHAAAKSGFKYILKYLLAQSVPLPHDILLSSTPGTIQFLLAKGFDLRSIVADGGTEMMCRVLESSWGNDPDTLEFARILVSAGWDPSLRNSDGETVIHVAVENGKIDVIKFFISQNVPLPFDILLVAASRTWKPDGITIPLIRFLIREGASVHAVAPNGDTILHLVITNDFSFESEDMEDNQMWPWKRMRYNIMESWEVIEILLRHGADPYAPDADGQTPIDLAEAKGHFFKENFLRLVQSSGAGTGPYIVDL